MSPLLLLIETSTDICSVALSRGEFLLCSRSSDESKSHARIIAPLIKDILEEYSLSTNDCDAIAVSEGPGSYTGLRVGASIAKGICYGTGIPLIAVNSLEPIVRLVAAKIVDYPENTLIVPMIDARRMEVYTSIFNMRCEAVSQTEAKIINEESFLNELQRGIVVFTGDGALKCKSIITHPNAVFIESKTDAFGMILPALKKFYERKFEDVAYFEPYYLKDFVAGVSKKRMF